MMIDKNLKCVKGSENSSDNYFGYNSFFKDWSLRQVDLKDLKKRVCRKIFRFDFENKLNQDVSFEVNLLLNVKGGYFSNSPKFCSFLCFFNQYYDDFVLSGSKKNFHAFQLDLEREFFSKPFRVLGENKKLYFRAHFSECFLDKGILVFKFKNPVFIDDNGNMIDFIFCENYERKGGIKL